MTNNHHPDLPPMKQTPRSSGSTVVVCNEKLKSDRHNTFNLVLSQLEE